MPHSHESPDDLDKYFFEAYDRPNIISIAHAKALEYETIINSMSVPYEDAILFARDLREELDKTCAHVDHEIIINGNIQCVGFEFDSLSRTVIDKKEDTYSAIDATGTSLGYLIDMPSEDEFNEGKPFKIIHMARTSPEALLRKQPGAMVYGYNLYYIPIDGSAIVDTLQTSTEPYSPYIEYNAPGLLEEIDAAVIGPNLTDSNDVIKAMAQIDLSEYAEQLDQDTELADEVAKYINTLHSFASIVPTQITGAENILIRPYGDAGQKLAIGSSVNQTITGYIKNIEFMPRTLPVDNMEKAPRAQLCFTVEVPQSSGDMLTAHIPLSQQLKTARLPITDLQY